MPDIDKASLERMKEHIRAMTKSRAMIDLWSPKMAELTDDWDPFPALDLGAAILLGKPIIVVVRDPDQIIPLKLADVADRVIRGPDWERQLQTAIEEMMPNAT